MLFWHFRQKRTSSCAVAKRPRDASCLSVVSFDVTKRRAALKIDPWKMALSFSRELSEEWLKTWTGELLDTLRHRSEPLRRFPSFGYKIYLYCSIAVLYFKGKGNSLDTCYGAGYIDVTWLVTNSTLRSRKWRLTDKIINNYTESAFTSFCTFTRISSAHYHWFLEKLFMISHFLYCIHTLD